MASAQFIASPYAYSGLYRSGYYGAYPGYTTYGAGYVAPAATAYAYPGYGYGASYLYK